jgi:hypothetical protein
MTGRETLGVILGAIAAFVWGFVFWGVFPTASMIFSSFSNEEAVSEALRSSASESGVYAIPDVGLMANADEYGRRYESGPVAMIFLAPRGLPLMPASVMISGFLTMFVSVLLMAFLLRLAGPGAASYVGAVGFVVLAGLVSVVLIDLGAPIWWRQSWSYWLANAIYHALHWLFVGLILAKFRRSAA